MMRIWKYVLPFNDHPIAKMPKGAKVLVFKFQNKQPCIWAYVNVNNPEEERKFWLVETGQVMSIDPSFLNFIGSDQFETEAGMYVAHLIEFVKKGTGNMQTAPI